MIGPVEVVGDDGAVVAVPGRKLQLLVAVLAAAPGRVTTVDRLVDVLYGEDLPSNPANAVQVLVSRLRRRLATAGLADVVDGGAAGYRLRLGPEDVDAGRFAARVAAGRAASDPTAAAAAFGDALALWRGEPLAGVGADAWADAGSVLRAIVTELGLDQLALAGGAVPTTPEGLADVLGDRSAVLVLDNCEQVVDEVAALATARVITSAALIMISVFLAFVGSEDVTMKMFGLGLATAVLLDATIVRMVLVPATMAMLGNANWWLPGWLDRILPHMDLEAAPESEPEPEAAPAEEPDAEPVAA